MKILKLAENMKNIYKTYKKTFEKMLKICKMTIETA